MGGPGTTSPPAGDGPVKTSRAANLHLQSLQSLDRIIEFLP